MTRTIREIMTGDPETLPADRPIVEAARMMRDHDIGDVLVMDGDRLRGVLTDRDITIRVVADDKVPQDTTVGDACSPAPATARPDEDAEQAARVMRDHAIRRLPVVDGGGKVLGVVSLGDVAVDRDADSALADISTSEPNT